MVKRYTLTKPQRAAAVLVAMGKSRAGQLLKFFKSDELRVMIDAAHTLKNIPQPDLEELVKEFESEFAVGAGLIDSAETMNKILSETLSDEEMYALTGAKTDQSEREVKESVWELTAKVDTDDLVAFFGNESPQLCAVVLSRLDSKTAASIIQRLDPALRKGTVARLLSSKPVPATVMATIEKRLDEAFKLSGPSTGSKEGETRLAEILMEMNKDISDDLLDALSPVVGDKKVAGVKSRLFRFEDIGTLTKESRSVLCDGLSTEVLTTALRGVDEEVSEAVLSAIGQRSRRMIESELADGRKINPAEVDQARKSISALALRLAAEGKIEIHSTEEAEAA
ncbi:FliG C-terminal domain-containing protein [Oricola cellulosilytica]|uniref:Flagellar motor switch protein FliG n=1 Tax=Oricola cellulosilytica TaxID=1429082 RepID=A0A4R0PGI9_9HYPH|nr:FliG C-terminal domain-containing protein [Oricola cellulosilytica]TCD16188.1 flagellar motor switch protein FliG [Oricola cellulosilytica]